MSQDNTIGNTPTKPKYRALIPVPRYGSLNLSGGLTEEQWQEIEGRDDAFFDEIRHLDLRGCQLKTMPDFIQRCKNLESLYLEKNQLKEITFKSEMPKLEILDLESNPLEVFPDIFQLPNLKKVFLGDNSLKKKLEVPDDIRAKMPNLIIYNLKRSEYIPSPLVHGILSPDIKWTGQDFKKIEEYDQSFFDQIKSLDLSDYDLSEIPPFVLRCKNLEVLNLSGNQLTKIPDISAKMPNLRQLDLSGNQLIEIPDISAEVPNLEKLDLRGCQLKTIPNFIKRCKNLEVLDLENNLLEYFPDISAEVPNLRQLDLSGNKLRKIPTLEMPKLEILDLESNRLEGFPDISKLPNLKKVFLGDNLLKKKLEVPDDIRATMPNLTIYNLKRSEYIAFPSADGHLSLHGKLTYNRSPGPPLWIPGKLTGAELKKIEEYDQSFFDKITHLDLSDNNLSKIPSFVLRCKNLKSLNLSNNKTLQWDKIEKYDQSFFDQIEHLDLSDNNLSKIPSFVLRCKNLKSLNLDRNKLNFSLPSESIKHFPGLSELPNLRELKVRENRLKIIPKPAAEDKNENHDKGLDYPISNRLAILWERLKDIFINKANKYTALKPEEDDVLNNNTVLKPEDDDVLKNTLNKNKNTPQAKAQLTNSRERTIGFEKGDKESGNNDSRISPQDTQKGNPALGVTGVPDGTEVNEVQRF